jgi:hypothetical protein
MEFQITIPTQILIQINESSSSSSSSSCFESNSK